MSMLALQSGVFVVAVLLTGLVRHLARRIRLLDLPVARSSHSEPTPVGGGLAIALLFQLIVAWACLAGLISLPLALSTLGAVLVAGIGLLDDWMHLDLQWRVPTQFLAAIWTVSWLSPVAPINFGVIILSQPLVLFVLAVIALVWLLNLYNFMDGIDGLAGSELVFVTLMTLALALLDANFELALLSATLLAAGAGFLVWNWPPAKIFMGDVGSSFTGFSLGLLALYAMQTGSMTIWTWVILLGVFVIDATVTLCRRYIAGAKWYEGHADHAYQKAARRYQSHGKVTITVLAINCLWLAPLAWATTQWQNAGLYLALLALLPLLLLAMRWQAGKAGEAGGLSAWTQN